jgi:hypothetical protein
MTTSPQCPHTFVTVTPRNERWCGKTDVFLLSHYSMAAGSVERTRWTEGDLLADLPLPGSLSEEEMRTLVTGGGADTAEPPFRIVRIVSTGQTTSD